MKKTLKFFLLPLLVFIAAITACNKEQTAATVEEAVDEALYSVQERGSMGRFGCYELVFPVTVYLPNGTTATVNSYEEMKEALRNYFNTSGTGNHNGARPRIQFLYPISLINQDGEVITVESHDELHTLRLACSGTFGNHGPNGHGQHGLSCFEIVFPVTIEFPDGTTAEAADREAFHLLVREWRQNNPGVQGRPKMVFPITVKMADDGSLVTVNSREEMRELKENCE